MAYLTDEQLKNMSFMHIGKNVQISDKVSIYNPEKMTIGDNTRIDDFCVISGNVSFGRNVHISVFCNIVGGSEGIIFEDFSGLACGCHVFAQSDDYSGLTLTNPTIPDKYKNVVKKKVRIGRHCIIGTKSVIFPGVIVAEGCSVGAMSMLTKSTEPWGVYFGIPAKKIKKRKQDMLVLEYEYLSRLS